jgi:carboxyl-terminal processing protease
MKSIMKPYRSIHGLLIICIAFLFITCERDILNPEENKLTRSVLYDIMKEWYLWYDTMPAVNPDDYHSLNALLDALRYSPTDRWSYVISTEEYDMFYGQGEYIGHGMGLIGDAEGNLWTGWVYDGSPAENQGVERGWQILSINGVNITNETNLDSLLGVDEVGVLNSFSFRKPGGQTTSLDIEKQMVDINSVLYSDIINLNDTKVGYLVYQHFLVSSVKELDAVFKEFQDNQIDDIIVDLRYNPGGQVDVAQHLGSLIAGEYAIKRDFVKLEYNDQKSERNLTRPFLDLEYMLTPTPERVFFITTSRSASASELVINGLFGLTGLTRPFEIYLIGDDTNGKPVGSISARYIDSTLIPITFRYMNRKNEGGFFDGLPANSYIEEDITKAFGDPEEPLLQEVLYFIENGSFTGTGMKKSIRADVFHWDRIPNSGAI